MRVQQKSAEVCYDNINQNVAFFGFHLAKHRTESQIDQLACLCARACVRARVRACVPVGQAGTRNPVSHVNRFRSIPEGREMARVSKRAAPFFFFFLNNPNHVSLTPMFTLLL